MDVPVDFGRLVPIEALIFVENGALREDVHQLALPSVTALVRGQSIEHGLVRCLLHIEVQRRVHPQAAFVNLIAAVLALEIAANFLDEVRRDRIRIALQVEDGRFFLRVRGLLCRDLPVFKHGVDHQVAPLQGPVGMQDGRIILRSLGQSCE